jgi:uncharacterized small protein (DUF1192 family)
VSLGQSDNALLKLMGDKILQEENAALKAEVERLTDALNKLTNTPANADGVDLKVNFWTKDGTRLPSSFQTFWMHDSAKEGRDAK